MKLDGFQGKYTLTAITVFQSSQIY